MRLRGQTPNQLWLQLMAIALLTNGLGPFGLKILAERHLAHQYQYQYLVFWYLTAFVISSIVFLAGHSKPFKREILIGATMGLFSLLGQVGLVLALSSNVPGYLVFSLALGGSLFVVVAGGMVLFKERLKGYGIAGLVLGAAAIVILTLP
ncbi:MAG: hypothetical protein ACRD11_00295 [Terriglobia bacterium]